MDRVSSAVPYTRRQDLLSPSRGRPDLLIIPCFGLTSLFVCEIYVVPIEILGRPPHEQPLRPKIVVSCSEFGCRLCIVGSNVYLFDSDSKRNSVVGSFDLSKYLDDEVEELELREDMISSDMAPMNHPKRFIRAVPTPGGKILAFSNVITFSPNASSYDIDFELYDPDTNRWEDIPPLQQDWDLERKSRCHFFEIISSTFLGDTKFLIQTNKGKQFSYTLGSSRWEDYKWIGHGFSFRGFSRRIVGGDKDDELCLTTSGVLDIKNVCKVPKVVCGYKNPALTYNGRSRAVIFDKGSSCCYILSTKQPKNLKIDKHYLDLEKYFEEKKGMEALCVRVIEKVDGENRAKEQHFIDTNGGVVGCDPKKLWDLKQKLLNDKNSLCSRLICAPKLGYRHLSTAIFRLKIDSNPIFEVLCLDDSTTFLPGGA